MSRYRRNYVPGGTYFVTVVAEDRRPILTDPMARDCLRSAVRRIQESYPFTVFAAVLLPDHLHMIWILPACDVDYPLRWARLKEHFTRSYLANGGHESAPTESRARHRERSVWQRRFWEHTCRDEADLKRCVDYLHWNPIKHSLVESPEDYPWSTYHRFAREGEYERNWDGRGTDLLVTSPGWE